MRLVEVVDWIVSQVGDGKSGDVEDGRTISEVAVASVNDALSEIWSRTQWPFRLGSHVVVLQENTMWYEMPSDFAEVHYDIPRDGAYASLTYKDFSEIASENPWFLLYPPGFGSLSTLVAARAEERHFGQPQHYTSLYADGVDLVGFFPAPDSDYIASVTSAVPVLYYRSAPELVDGQSEVPVPQNLVPACKYLALSYVKQSREHQDFQADEVRAERYIQREMNRIARRGRAHRRFRPVGHR